MFNHIQVACPQTEPSRLVMVGMVTGHERARAVPFKMPRSLSTDFRWRIVWLYFHKGFTMNKVADTMVIAIKRFKELSSCTELMVMLNLFLKFIDQTEYLMPKER